MTAMSTSSQQSNSCTASSGFIPSSVVLKVLKIGYRHVDCAWHDKKPTINQSRWKEIGWREKRYGLVPKMGTLIKIQRTGWEEVHEEQLERREIRPLELRRWRLVWKVVCDWTMLTSFDERTGLWTPLHVTDTDLWICPRWCIAEFGNQRISKMEQIKKDGLARSIGVSMSLEEIHPVCDVCPASQYWNLWCT